MLEPVRFWQRLIFFMIKRLTSVEIKSYLLAYYRYVRHFFVVATEVPVINKYVADVVAATNRDVVEVEIKTSLADFYKEFQTKEGKHDLYLKSSIDGTVRLRNDQYKKIPNRLFFAAEKYLIPDMLRVLEGTPYGLIEIDTSKSQPVEVVKTASKLHSVYPQRVYNRAILRCTSELCTLYKIMLGQ